MNETELRQYLSDPNNRTIVQNILNESSLTAKVKNARLEYEKNSCLLNLARELNLPYQIDTTLTRLVLFVNKIDSIIILLSDDKDVVDIYLYQYYDSILRSNRIMSLVSRQDEIISNLVYILSKYNIEIKQ